MSKEVKRYDPFGYDGLSALMHEHELGEWVRAEDYDALLAENERLRQLTSEKVMSSTMLREFVARDGGVTIGLEGGACALMAQALGAQLYESEALNYIEASFDSPDYPDMGLITVTLKRETGKTPHELRKEAEAERDALLAERDALAKEAERTRMRVKELDLLFGRYLLAMKAAVIDADQRGDEEGMRWIYNSLAGPGELPAEDEIDAQAFFDREIKPIDDGMAEVMAYHRAALQGEQP